MRMITSSFIDKSKPAAKFPAQLNRDFSANRSKQRELYPVPKFD